MDSRLRGNDNVLSTHLDVIPAKAGIHVGDQHGVWDENITELSSEKHKGRIHLNVRKALSEIFTVDHIEDNPLFYRALEKDYFDKTEHPVGNFYRTSISP